MRQFKRGLLLLIILLFATACAHTNNGGTPPSNLDPGAFYKFWVRPIDGNGQPGPWSNESTTEIPSALVNPVGYKKIGL